MVVSAGHDPCLIRTMQEAAKTLSRLSALHSPSLSPLLPEIMKLDSQDGAREQQAVRVLGGSLAVNNKGGLALPGPVTKSNTPESQGNADFYDHYAHNNAMQAVLLACCL